LLNVKLLVRHFKKLNEYTYKGTSNKSVFFMKPFVKYTHPSLLLMSSVNFYWNNQFINYDDDIYLHLFQSSVIWP